MDYHQRIRDLREDHDLTQLQVASILGTSQTMYARYERGANELPIRHLIALANLYISDGVGNDTVIVNTDLWKCDLANQDKYTITLKANDRVYIDGATLQTSYLTPGEPYKHLNYDKNNNGELDAADIVIQIIGANSIKHVESGYITFEG